MSRQQRPSEANSKSAFAELGLKESVRLLAEEVRAIYLADAAPWVVGYSGGKDSTATLQMVWNALRELPPEQLTKPIHVISTDTLVENPIVAAWVTRSLETMQRSADTQNLPLKAHRLTPEVNDTFWVNLIGRGYPAPRHKFRWCTERMKIKPSNAFITRTVREGGEAILVLGTRKAESAKRSHGMTELEKKRIRDKLSPNDSLPGSLVYSPVENWSNDDVWMYLMQVKNPWGYDNRDLLTMYQGASQDGECPLVVDSSTPSCGDSRFGCWVCTLVEKDKSMQAMIQNDEEKSWMLPLLELRNALDVKDDRPLRDFRRMSGAVQLFHDRTIPGPYKQSSREEWLRQLLKAQRWIRDNGPAYVRDLDLVTLAELEEIRRIWVVEKHELEDVLPRVFMEAMGTKYPGKRLDDHGAFGPEELKVLKDLCGQDDLHYQMARDLLDISQRFKTKARRAGLYEELEDTIARSFYRDEQDAIDRARREQAARAEGRQRVHGKPGSPIVEQEGQLGLPLDALPGKLPLVVNGGDEPVVDEEAAPVILDSITLFDFGLYAGQQTIELTPTSEKKPVILFGGLNGGGKTTFLDAINLVLYGNRAKTSNRNGLAYPDYLRECIHQGVDPSDGAWIELRFRQWADGNEHAYLINRSWRSTGAGIKEELEVRVDGKFDQVLTESWSDHVEGFLPLGLSRLYLFDGEKIEALADLEHSKEALGTAMASLLGLDLVDQLSIDLSTLEKHKRIALKDASERAEIETLQERVREHENRIAVQVERRAQLETELDQRRRRVKQLEEEFRKQGGEAFQSREAYRTEASSLEQRIQEIEANLTEEASGPLPLLMAKQLLEGLSHQAKREAQAAEVATLVETLKERDQDLMGLLESKGTSKKVVTEMVAHLEKDRSRRVDETVAEVYLGFSTEAQQLLAATLQPALPESAQRATKAIAQLRDLQEAHLQVERKLQAVPDEEAIRGYVDTFEKARIEEQLAKSQRDALLLEMEEATRTLEADKERLSRLIEDAVGTDFGREDDQRVANSAARVRDTLRAFRTSILKLHVGRIEEHVMECFKSVLRKKRLIDKASIDPETFEVELRRSSGKVLSPDRLSAGERQLFAVSLLWGLARASGRPIPTIIDTPLGRLDGTHREHLVERYFPHASHQVILLSTNKEIDREYYQSLKPYIGREYLLDYDEDAGKTTVRKGYFW